MGKQVRVARPTKQSEYAIIHASIQARKGWEALVATQRNVMADAWDFLTRTPMDRTPKNYPLKGALGTVTRGGDEHQRWQHKPTIGGSARIWFYVEDRVVYLEDVHTHHPNATE
jgi:hypothetical protein